MSERDGFKYLDIRIEQARVFAVGGAGHLGRTLGESSWSSGGKLPLCCYRPAGQGPASLKTLGISSLTGASSGEWGQAEPNGESCRRGHGATPAVREGGMQAGLLGGCPKATTQRGMAKPGSSFFSKTE